MAIRVVQWTTGNVGKRSVRAVVGQPRPRAGRLLRLVGRQGRSRRRRAVRHRPRRRRGDRRRRRAARAAARLRRLQPDVARHRRAGPHPRGRRQRRQHGRVHQRPGQPRRPRAHRRRVRARRLVDVRHGHQPRLRRAGRHRHGRHLRPDRQGHDRRGVRHHALRLARHRAAVRLRPADRRSRAAGDGGRRARRCSARRSRWSPTPSASSSTTSCARPSTPRPPRTSSWTRGRSRPGASPGSPPAGRAEVGDRTVVELNVRWRKGQTLDPDWTDRGGPRHPGRRPAHGAGEARVPAAARLRGHDVRRLHGARDDHDGHAGRQRHPATWSPRRRASSPTPTCR